MAEDILTWTLTQSIVNVKPDLWLRFIVQCKCMHMNSWPDMLYIQLSNVHDPWPQYKQML